MIYYIADTHFGDSKVFRKCSRPFSGIEEMKSEIMRRWNERIKDEDTVYVLGDIANDNCLEAIDAYRALNGHKYLIVGNHDLNMLEKIKESGVFEGIDYITLIEDEGRKVCLCHYPLMDWMEFSRGGYHVYGHIHNKTSINGHAYWQIKDYFKGKLAYNAGVDVTGYQPVTLNEMIELKEINENEPYIN